MGTLAAFSAYMSAAGTVIAAAGAHDAAQAEAGAADLKAFKAERDAELVKEQSDKEELRLRKQIAKEKGETIAALGVSGRQIAGSALDILRENDFNAELDIMELQFAGIRGEEALLSGARDARLSARSIRAGTDLAAAGSLLSGGARLAARSDSGSGEKTFNDPEVGPGTGSAARTIGRSRRGARI